MVHVHSKVKTDAVFQFVTVHNKTVKIKLKFIVWAVILTSVKCTHHVAQRDPGFTTTVTGLHQTEPTLSKFVSDVHSGIYENCYYTYQI